MKAKKKSTPRKRAKVSKMPDPWDEFHDAILKQDPTAKLAAMLARDAAMDYHQAREKLKERGGISYQVETMTGHMFREYPEAAAMRDAWQRLVKIFKEFRLTLKEGKPLAPTTTSPILKLVGSRS